METILQQSVSDEDVLSFIDAYIGKRIRIRRNLLGLSQDQLAKALGISFQQIQKYERGNNRISGSRIWHMARILSVPVNYFFDGIEQSLRANGVEVSQYVGDMLSDSHEQIESYTPTVDRQQEVRELLNASLNSEDEKLMNDLLTLVKKMSDKK